MKYRPDIDGLRALAVLAVLVFHVDPAVLPGGFIGVDIFFVISGYLITIILWNAFASPSFSFLGFYARRAHRLLPALYATVACTLLLALAWFPHSAVNATAWSAASALASVSNIRFSLQAGYFDVSVLRKPLLHTWSLAVEEQFYLFWPVLLKLTYSHRHRFSKFLAIPVIVFLTVISELCTRSYPSYAYFLAPFRFYEFMIGAALHLFAVPTSFIAQEFLSVAGLGAIFYSLLVFSGDTAFPGFSALVPTLATAMLIQAPSSTISRVFSFRPLTIMGRISYSVYLVHWPLIVAVRLVSARDLVPEEAVFLFFASIALGYGLHHAVETRFRSTKTREENSPRQSITTLLTFAGIGVLLCFAAYWTSHLAKVKYVRESKSVAQGGSQSREIPVPGMNISAVRYWTKKLKSNDPAERGWVSVPVKQAGVPGFLAWHGRYVPKKTKPRARMMLFGDSHMGAAMSAFMRIAMENKFQLDAYMGTGCPAVFGLKKLYTDKRMVGGTEACMDLQKSWQKKVSENAYDFVVISSRWQWHFENGTYGKSWINEERVLNDQGEVPRSIPERRALFERGLRQTMKTIVRSGAHGIIVSQFPNVGKEVKNCLERGSAKKALMEGRQPKECLGVTREEAMRRCRFIDGLVRRLGFESPRVTGVVPSKYYCDNWEDKYCRVVYDGKEMYGDSSHITNFGALFFEQRWREDAFGGVNWSYRNPNKRKEPMPTA